MSQELYDPIHKPLKIFAYDVFTSHRFKTRHFIITAASSHEVSDRLMHKNFGLKTEGVLLPNAGHEILYDQKGEKPLEVQFKILWNSYVKL